jgi:cytosine/adenosine deaminase-related metal-dependent hydrolase
MISRKSRECREVELGQKTLVRGGWIVSMDPEIGDVPQGDLLIDGSVVEAVRPNIEAGDCEIVDAAGMIVMPGFVDTHRHTWQSCIRHGCCDMSSSARYFREILGGIGGRYRPEDVYTGTWLGAVSALEAGTTTLMDWAHVMNTPDHADAAIEALRTSGIRAVFGHGWPLTEPQSWMDASVRDHPADIRRLRRDVIPGDDGLITLCMAARGPEMAADGVWQADLAMARELGLRSSIHMGAAGRGPRFHAIAQMHDHGLLGPDLVFVHCNTSSDDELKMMADAGVEASLGVQVEQLTLAYGDLPIDRMLDVGIRPSLSSDTETKGAGDMFTQMRLLISAYRAFRTNGHSRATNAPEMLTTRDVLELATIVGARANGLGKSVGSLTPGKKADMIMIRADDLNLMPVTDPVAAIVTAAHPGNVDSVMVDGRFVKRRGEMLVSGLEDLRARARASQDYLYGKAA